MTEPLKEFISTVRNYCVWVESKPASEIEEAKKALQLLAALYHYVLKICPSDSGEDIDGERISDEEWKKIYKRFGALPFNYYSDFFSPAKMALEKPETGDLADDLTDIYRDLKAGLGLYDKGYVAEAMWEWKQNFQIHWGRHAAGALNALHCYIADEGIEI
jgi:hypothetical protein